MGSKRKHKANIINRYVFKICVCFTVKLKGKVLPYSLLSVGCRAEPGVQAVNLQVTF